MTHAAPRRPTKFPRVWLAPLLAVAVMVIATALDLLSRSILIDFAAWWPVWLAMIAAWFLSRGRRVGALRVSGLVSLGLLAVFFAFVVGHIQGWSLMPSSVSHLEGSSEVAVSTAAISARMDGDLKVTAGTTRVLYSVAPLRGGGNIGIPRAVERSQDGSVSVDLTEVVEPGLYRFAGWDVVLSTMPRWSLSLGGTVDADLSTLEVESIQLEGSGVVRLGPTDGNSPISVDGKFTIFVPTGAPVRVIGPATVPQGWQSSDGVFTSPEGGMGWVIGVGEGSSVEIRER